MHVDDSVAVRGALVLDLVDAGFVVVGSDASVDVVVSVVDGGFSVVATGAESRAGFVADGPPALVELELGHRVRALVRDTPPRPTTSTARVLAVDLYDAAQRARFAEHVGAALVDKGVALGNVDNDDRVCVDGNDDRVSVAFGADNCGDVVLVVDRGTVDADVAGFVDAVLVLRPPPPPPPAPPPPPPPPPPRDVDPLALDVGVGVLARPVALDPWVRLAGRYNLRDDGARLGGFVVVDGSGAADPVAIVEARVVGGVFGGVDVSDSVRVDVGLGAGVAAHGWSWDATDAGVAFDPVVVVPVVLDVALIDEVRLSLGVDAGASARGRQHVIGETVAWERGPIFLGIHAGLCWDLL